MNDRETWEEKKKHIHGIKIGSFNITMIIVMCAFYMMLGVQTVDVYKSHLDLQNFMQKYIMCQQMASQGRNGSDFLTTQVRYFTETGKLEYVDAYFEEAKEAKHRDKALEEIVRVGSSVEIEQEMESALKESNDLMNVEYYAMKLTAKAYNLDLNRLPEEVRNIKLSAEDRNLTSAQMEGKARDLVFSKEYTASKEAIYQHLENLTESLLDKTHNNFEDSAEELAEAIKQNRIWLLILFLLNIVMFIFITVLVIRPLKIYVGNVEKDTLFDIVGSYEFKYLALTYNSIYEVNAANKQNLVYTAEHDKLTGVLNRTAFEGLKSYLSKSLTPMAFLVLDVDRFKTVNDTYGHDTGDVVLKKVASLLQDHIRSNDKVIRYGGDEFVIVMMDITEENSQVITQKVDDINAILKNPGDGLPPVSVSCGAVFSSEGYSDELLKKADEAMYAMKQAGRGGCRFAEK